MTITRRTCANCVAFNPSHLVSEQACPQHITIAAPDKGQQRTRRQPTGIDYCARHMTRDEFNRYGLTAGAQACFYR